MPKLSPTPIYNPSALPINLRAFAARLTQSIGVSTIMGIPHTPIPTLG
jgi:hypothetical protein